MNEINCDYILSFFHVFNVKFFSSSISFFFFVRLNDVLQHEIPNILIPLNKTKQKLVAANKQHNQRKC